MSTVRFVVLMLVFPTLVAVERTAHYAVRALLFPFMAGPASEGGLGMTMSEVGAAYGMLSALTVFTPLVGGLIALATGPRITLVAGALLTVVAYVVLAAASKATLMVGFVVWAVGYGMLLPSLYAVMAREFADQREPFRIVPFVLSYGAVNLGGLVGPALSGLSRDLSPSLTLPSAAAAVAMTIVLAALTAVALLGAKSRPVRSKGHVELGLLVLLVAVTPALVVIALAFDWIFRAAGATAPPEVLLMINPAVVLLVSLALAVAMLLLGALRKRPYTLALIGAGIVITAIGTLPMVLADVATSMAAQLVSIGVLAIGEALVLTLTMARMATDTHPRFATLVLAVWFSISRGIFALGSAASTAGWGKPLLIAAATGCVVMGPALLALGPALRRRFFAPQPLV